MMRVMLWVHQSEHEMLRSKVRPDVANFYLISCFILFSIYLILNVINEYLALYKLIMNHIVKPHYSNLNLIYITPIH